MLSEIEIDITPVATSEDTNFISQFIKHGTFKNAWLTFLPNMVER